MNKKEPSQRVALADLHLSLTERMRALASPLWRSADAIHATHHHAAHRGAARLVRWSQVGAEVVHE
jgi:hypothetical protein